MKKHNKKNSTIKNSKIQIKRLQKEAVAPLQIELIGRNCSQEALMARDDWQYMKSWFGGPCCDRRAIEGRTKSSCEGLRCEPPESYIPLACRSRRDESHLNLPAAEAKAR